MKRIALVTIITASSVFFVHHDADAIGPCKGTPLPVRVITRDAGGTLVGGINYAIYSESTNPDGKPYFGSQLAVGKTDSGGQSSVACLDASKAPYAVKVYESNGTYGFFTMWSSEMTMNETFVRIAEFKMSSLYVLMRDAEGTVIKKAYFDVYMQGYDVNGKPIVDENRLDVDKLVVSNYDTGDFGAKTTFLAPGNYVVRVKMTGGKDYYYVWEQLIVAGTVTTLDYKLSTLRTIIEDGFGALVKSQKINIYRQDRDVRGGNILGPVMVSDQSTGTTGGALANLKPGTYVVRITGTYGNFTKWNVVITNQELTTVTYRLSGFRIIIRDATGAYVKGAKFSIGTQKIDVAGKPILDAIVVKDATTGAIGYRDLYLPPSTYVLVYGDKRLFQLDANENQFTTIDWPRSVTVRPRSEVKLTNPYGNVNLTLRKITAPKVNLTGYSTTVSKAYKLTATTVKKAYTITFYYDDATLSAKGLKADKLRIAFYDSTTKKWSIVGKNNPTKYQATSTRKSKGTFILIAVN